VKKKRVNIRYWRSMFCSLDLILAREFADLKEEPAMTRSPGTIGALEAILTFNQDRKPRLVRLKLRRMLEDPFTFFRGTNHLFVAAWPELQPPEAGPEILICGDLHLENFGAYRTVEGDFRYDINDFDESIVAASSIDLVRCTTSIFLAAEQWRLTPTQATGMALAYLAHYRKAVLAAVEAGAVGEVAPRSGHGVIWELLGTTASGVQQALLDRNIKRKTNGRPFIRRAGNHPEVSRKRAGLIREAIEAYGQKFGEPDAFRVHDVTGRIAGVGSLGVRRYLALVEGEGAPHGHRLLDIKQVEVSVLAGVSVVPQPSYDGDEARRVVCAQTTLQGHPAAGLDALKIGNHSYRILEMIPDENRSSLDRLRKQPAKLREAVETAGRLTAWSQLRGGRLAPGLREPPKRDHWSELADWSGGAAIDAVLAAAARYAERTNEQYAKFRQGIREQGGIARYLGKEQVETEEAGM
jgi:uncharacterized protein (DUF2252 family)